MMRLTSSCTETSTRSVPAHVCTTDGFPRKTHKPGRTCPISHTQTPGLPPSIRSDTYLNMTLLPEKLVCLMIKLTMDTAVKHASQNLLPLTAFLQDKEYDLLEAANEATTIVSFCNIRELMHLPTVGVAAIRKHISLWVQEHARLFKIMVELCVWRKYFLALVVFDEVCLPKSMVDTIHRC